MHASQRRLARLDRLRKRRDFLAVQERGRRVSGQHYLLLGRPRARGEPRAPVDDGAARVGITVSRKVGNAVERNRVKRWVRESYRRLQPLVPETMDLVVVARPSAAAAGFFATLGEIDSLLRKLAR